MPHGRIPHDNTFFLRKPLSHQSAPGNIARRHNAAHHEAHGNGINRQIRRISYTYVAHTGKDRKYA